MANEAMTIGNITVKPGEMKRGKIEIGKDPAVRMAMNPKDRFPCSC